MDAAGIDVEPEACVGLDASLQVGDADHDVIDAGQHGLHALLGKERSASSAGFAGALVRLLASDGGAPAPRRPAARPASGEASEGGRSPPPSYLTPRGERLLTCRVDAHGLDQAGHLEDGADVLLQPAEPDVTARGTGLLHGRHEHAHARAVDVAHAAQVHDQPRLTLPDESGERSLHLVRGRHVQVAFRRDHGHFTGLGHINVHALLRSRTGRPALFTGRGTTAGAVLEDGPPGAAFPVGIYGEIIGNRLHQEKAVSVVRYGVEIRRLVLLGVEGLAEVLDLYGQRLVAGSHGDADGLSGLTLIGVLDRVIAELADGQEQVRPIRPRDAMPFQLLAQPFPQADELACLARHGKVALGGGMRHSTVTLLARLRGWSTSEPLSTAV